MKILVTGGAGFIGSNLIDGIIEKNEIVCLDNFNDYYNPLFKRRNIEGFLNNKNFNLIEEDIRDKKKINEIFEQNQFECVIHLASMVGVRNSLENPQLYQEVNIGGTINLLEASKNNGVKNFIFASSSSVYGEAKVPFSEKNPVSPISPYGATKLAGEIFCEVYSKLYSLPVTCFRFFTVYGQRGRPEMAIHKFTNLIEKKEQIPVFAYGKSKRDFTHVSDIVRGIKNCIPKKFEFEIINLGNSSPVELNYIISLIEENLGKTALKKFYPAQVGDSSITFADISKAKKLLGFNPKIKIETGVKKFVDWYFENNK